MFFVLHSFFCIADCISTFNILHFAFYINTSIVFRNQCM